MIAGHFGFAAIVKSRRTFVPLWTLMLATVWLDIIFVPLYLAGIETLEPVPGAPHGYGGNVIHAVYTHSLVGAVLLSVVLGVAAWAMWSKRVGIVVGLVAFSHWLLDLVVHRHDMPVLPGNIGGLPLLGFGLWQHPAASILAEALLVLAGAWLYGRAASSAASGRGRAWAHVATALIAVFGGLILFLDVTGLIG
jgi:hypothetical protein